MYFPVADRIFQKPGGGPGKEEWFFHSREGVKGPFPNQGETVKALRVFVKYCIENGLTGGRDRHWWLHPDLE